MASFCSAVFFVMLCISLAYAHGCTKLPASAAFRGTCYFQYVHGRGFIKRVCPPGTRFSEVQCGCIRALPSYMSARSRIMPSLLSALRARALSGSAEQTSREEDDDSSSRFDLGRSITSRINQLLYRRPSHGGDDFDDNDEKEREKEDGDDEKVGFSSGRFDLGSSIRSRINQILYGRPSYGGGDFDDNDEKEREKDDGDDEKEGLSSSRLDPTSAIRSRINQILFGRPSYGGNDLDDKYERESEKDDDVDERGRLYRFLQKSARTIDTDDGREDGAQGDNYNSRFRNDDFFDGDEKGEDDRDDRFGDDNDVGKSSISATSYGNNNNRWNDESSGLRPRRGDSSFSGESLDRDDMDEKDDDRDDNDYSNYSPGFTTKFLMTKGRKYRFEDLLDNGLNDDNEILLDFGGIFEKKFYGLFEYVDDILDDVFDDDFEDFYSDLFDDDGYDDIFAPKYAHYFKDSDDDFDDKYEDFEDFFENYSKLSSMDEDDLSREDRREYGDGKRDDDNRGDDYGDDTRNSKRGDDYGEDRRDEDKRGDEYGDGKENSDDNVNQSGVWSGRSGFDIHRNGYGDDRDGDTGERDKRLFDFGSTLKSGTKSEKSSDSLPDIDSILERFYDN